MKALRSVILLSALALGGCATGPQIPPNVTAEQAILAPGVVCAVPVPDAQLQNVAVAQNITVRIHGHTFGFQAQIQIADGEVDFVALDSLGRRGMTVKWHGGQLEVTRAPWLPDFVRPADILTDIAIVYWPVQAVAPTLAACGVTVTETAQGRVVKMGAREVLRVTFDGGDGWNRPAHLHNAAFGFDIDIQSDALQ